jgi:hypothetical protein
VAVNPVPDLVIGTSFPAPPDPMYAFGPRNTSVGSPPGGAPHVVSDEMVTVVPTGPDPGHTVNVPPSAGSWLQVGAVTVVGGAVVGGALAGADEVSGAVAGAGNVGDAVVGAGESGDGPRVVAGVVVSVLVLEPDGPGPRDPDRAGPQAASRSRVMVTGKGSSFMAGRRLLVTNSHFGGRHTAAAPKDHSSLTAFSPAVSGKVSRNVDPVDTSLRTLMPPPSEVACSSAMARPSPLPPPERAGSAL